MKTVTNWNDVAIDTPILVRDYKDQEWIREHFAEYTDGKIYAWADGKTSYTADGYVLDWNYAKLAKINNDKKKKKGSRK